MIELLGRGWDGEIGGSGRQRGSWWIYRGPAYSNEDEEQPPIQMKMRRRIRIYRGSGAGSVSVEAPSIQMKMRSTIKWRWFNRSRTIVVSSQKRLLISLGLDCVSVHFLVPSSPCPVLSNSVPPNYKLQSTNYKLHILDRGVATNWKCVNMIFFNIIIWSI